MAEVEVPLNDVVAAPPGSRVVTSDAAVYLVAMVLGLVVGIALALIYLAIRESRITAASIECQINNGLADAALNSTGLAQAQIVCVNTLLQITPDAC